MSSLHDLAEFLASLIAWFNNKEKATAVVLGMAALFAMTALPLIWRHRAFIARLRSGAVALRKIEAEASWSASDRLNAAGTALNRDPVLGGAWVQYRAAIREDPRRDGVLVNLVNPADWFTPDRLPGYGYEKWAGTLAGVFLTVGLLFTFVGLSAALLRASDAGVDAVHLRDAINGILSVSSAKFITSIAGIIFFVGWTLIARWFSSSQHHAAHRFAAAAQVLTTMMSPEIILIDQLLAAREQTERMKTLADDVAVAFEAKLTSVIAHRLDALPEKVNASMQPMVAAIEGMGTRIATELRHGVSDAAGHEMLGVIEALKKAADELRNAQGGIGNSGNEFGASVAQAADRMTTSVVRMTEAIDHKIGDLEGRIQRVDEALGKGAASISAVGNDMTAVTRDALGQALKTISDQAAQAAEEARRQSHAHMEPLLAGLRDLVGEIRKSADEGRGHLVDGGKAAADAITAAASISGDKFTVASSNASASLTVAATAMADRMEAAVVQFQALERAIASHVGHLRVTGDTITSAGNAFGAISAQLRQTAEPVATALTAVEASARQAADTLRLATTSHETMRDAARHLTEVSTSASAAFESYRQRFQDTDKALGETVGGLVDGSIQLADRFSKIVNELDGHLGEAVGKLRMGIEDIRDMVRDLAESAAEIRSVVPSVGVPAE